MLLNLHYVYQSKHLMPLINSNLSTKSYTGDIIMPTDAQLLIGKVLQIKDKIIAKRH